MAYSTRMYENALTGGTHLEVAGIEALRDKVNDLEHLIGKLGDHLDKQTSRILDKLSYLETEIKTKPTPVVDGVEKPDLDMYKKKKAPLNPRAFVPHDGLSNDEFRQRILGEYPGVRKVEQW